MIHKYTIVILVYEVQFDILSVYAISIDLPIIAYCNILCACSDCCLSSALLVCSRMNSKCPVLFCFLIRPSARRTMMDPVRGSQHIPRLHVYLNNITDV